MYSKLLSSQVKQLGIVQALGPVKLQGEVLNLGGSWFNQTLKALNFKKAYTVAA